MTQIELIKDLQGRGQESVKIPELLGLARKTASKYMSMEYFEEKEPVKVRTTELQLIP